MNETSLIAGGARRRSPEPVGIVVQGRDATADAPRTVAFVWGFRLVSKPSLPFGRWKTSPAPAS